MASPIYQEVTVNNNKGVVVNKTIIQIPVPEQIKELQGRLNQMNSQLKFIKNASKKYNALRNNDTEEDGAGDSTESDSTK